MKLYHDEELDRNQLEPLLMGVMQTLRSDRFDVTAIRPTVQRIVQRISARSILAAEGFVDSDPSLAEAVQSRGGAVAAWMVRILQSAELINDYLAGRVDSPSDFSAGRMQC